MGKNTVGANGQSIVTKNSGGKVISGPDVCKTPVGSGIVPIPYPNTSQSSDLTKGSNSVKIGGAPACLRDSNFSRSTGDQAGTAGGVMSGQTGAQADPVSYSFDIKIEGQGVVRNMDTFVSNSWNTPSAPLLQSPLLGPNPVIDAPKCEYCGGKEHDFADQFGNHVGSGQLLRKNITPDVTTHRWYTSSYSLEAHHLIPTESMDDEDWSAMSRDFGYDINRAKNGIMLPNEMDLACQLHVPLHRGNHNKSKAGGETYPGRVEKELARIKEKVKAGDYCNNPKGLIEKVR